ncbi:quinon protein alcohol dehydrogenase-like superfamily [Syncephalis fuscata]|nr:quinon protein alcohol dehydrogenase-like superfamily [Syncephalis fuscata]
MLTETVLTAGDGGLQLWDPRTGTILSSYKLTGGDCHPHALAVGNASFRGGSLRPGVIYAAQADKAMMHVYQFEKDQPFIKFTIPEAGSAVVVSHSGIYCAMGTNTGRIYVWEVTSGTLLRVIDAHFKTVNVLRFTDDDAALVSGSADATVKVWLMGGVVAKDREEAPVPCHAWSDHALPITDIYCTGGGFVNGRVFTVSRDHTCKIWSLNTGQLLLTLLFPVALHACCVHPSGTVVLVERQQQQQQAPQLWEAAGQNSMMSNGSGVEGVALPGARGGQSGKIFNGHSGVITGLAISMDGTLLVSSSEDTTVKVWDMIGRQLLRTFTQHKGVVTNVQLLLKPDRVGALTNTSTAHQKLAAPPIRAFKRTRLMQNDSNAIGQPALADAMATNTMWTFLGDCTEQAPDAQQKLRDRAEQLQRELQRVQQHHTRVRQLQDELYQGAVSAFLANRPVSDSTLPTANQDSTMATAAKEATPDQHALAIADIDMPLASSPSTTAATPPVAATPAASATSSHGRPTRTRRQRAH